MKLLASVLHSFQSQPVWTLKTHQDHGLVLCWLCVDISKWKTMWNHCLFPATLLQSSAAKSGQRNILQCFLLRVHKLNVLFIDYWCSKLASNVENRCLKIEFIWKNHVSFEETYSFCDTQLPLCQCHKEYFSTLIMLINPFRNSAVFCWKRSPIFQGEISPEILMCLQYTPSLSRQTSCKESRKGSFQL